MAKESVVLVVDDSRVSRLHVRRLLEAMGDGWTFVEAGNGDEALEKTVDMRPDFMLLDYNMPGMNGVELAQKLLERYPGLPGALVTANIQDGPRQRAEALGLAYIAKPVSTEKLENFMHDTLAIDA